MDEEVEKLVDSLKRLRTHCDTTIAMLRLNGLETVNDMNESRIKEHKEKYTYKEPWDIRIGEFEIKDTAWEEREYVSF